MLNYKLKSFLLPENSVNYVEDYLNLIGIKKAESFIGVPPKEDELSPWKLANMEQAVEMLGKHLQKNNEIFLVVDSDPDGYTSGSIIYNFIKDIFPKSKLQYCLHPEKEHGVVLADVPIETDLIIIPDAGSNQWDDIEELVKRGKDIIILDHHIVDGLALDSEHVALVNSTEKNFANPSLSGAGVAFKFIQAYDEKYDCGGISSNYYDLAALGIISDMMYTGNLDNNYIIYQGLHNIKNQFFKALLNKQSFSISNVETPTKIDIAFYITPVINGVIRVGSMEDKMFIFEALTTKNSTEVFPHTCRGVTKEESLYESAARLAVNLKSRQDTLVNRIVENIYAKLDKQDINEYPIIIYKTSAKNENEVPKTLTGLIATKIVAKYNKPVLVLRPKLINGIQYYLGSGRGKNAEGFTSFKKLLNDSGLVEYASGHDSAFGSSVKESNIIPLLEYSKEQLKDIDFNVEAAVEVDQIFTNQTINKTMLQAFADCNFIYGNGIPQPCYAFELVVSRDSFKIMGARKDTMKLSFDGIDFIKFKAAKEIKQLENTTTNYVKVSLIGTSQINEYIGYRKVQVKINEMEILNMQPMRLI